MAIPELMDRVKELEQFEDQMHKDHLPWMKAISWFIKATAIVFIGLIASFAWSASSLFSNIENQKAQLARIEADQKAQIAKLEAEHKSSMEKLQSELKKASVDLHETHQYLLRMIYDRPTSKTSYSMPLPVHLENIVFDSDVIAFKTTEGLRKAIVTSQTIFKVEGAVVTKSEFASKIKSGYTYGDASYYTEGVFVEVNITKKPEFKNESPLYKREAPADRRNLPADGTP